MDDAAETPKPEYNGEALREEGGKWMERIRAAETREEDWRKDAAAAEKSFSNNVKAEHGDLYDFNILHSNVETIVPAIYNSTPVPDVRRRWVEAIGDPPTPPQMPPQQEGQPAPQIAPEIVRQFQEAMGVWQAKQLRDQAAKDFGVMVERAITVQIDDNRLDKEIERSTQDSFLAGRGIVRLRMEVDEEGEWVRNERITFEAVSWRDYRQGPGTRWETLPWLAFRHALPGETLEKFEDSEMVRAQADPAPATGTDDKDDIGFWEIWCKDTRTVKFVREHDGHIIKQSDDPLGLRDFFPMPEPVQPITLTAKMTPVCPFSIYKKLADELNLCTQRINKIMAGLKVRGLVIGSAAKLVELADAEDNQLVVADDLEGLGQIKSLDNAVLWWPIQHAITVLQQLYQQREQIKSAIYEMTGISDIIRGSSKASETLGAQQIKTQWGSLRIQKMQRLIARQVRDLFALMAEIIPAKFSEQTLFQMTGIEVTDAMRELMKQPILTAYRVDVETDSTIQADLTRQKGEMTQFMQGTAQYFQTMNGVVQQAPQMAQPAAEIYASFARVFRLGKQAEDAIEQMVQIAKGAANQERPDPEAAFKEKELALELEHIKAKMGLEIEKLTLEQRKAESEARRADLQVQIEAAKLRLAGIDLALKGRKQEADEASTAAELAIEWSQKRPVAIGAQ